MDTQQKITVIGSGVMGGAIIGGLLQHGLTQPDHITAVDLLDERLNELNKHYAINTTSDAVEAVKDVDVLILSVKPQKLKSAIKDIKGKLKAHALVLSIVAGIPIKVLQEELDHSCVVRAMPNTPAQIGQGITVWTTSGDVTEEQKQVTQKILLALGEEVFVEEEYYMDMATALSGTGPAYVFLFMEALIDAGVHLGFPRRTSEKLVLQTMKGSLEYYKGKKDHPAHLRNEVTSPGGTSAAAIYYLEKAGIRTALSRAVWAAYERSRELGRGKVTKHPESRETEDHK